MSFQRTIAFVSVLTTIGSAGATAQDPAALQTGHVAVHGMAVRAVPQRPTTTQNAEEVLADLERQWDDAVRTRDTEALNRLIADDFRYLSPFSGSANATKEQQVKMFGDLKAREKNVTRSHAITDTTLDVSGDTAIATGLATTTSKTPGGESKERGRFIHVWRKRGGQWRMVADHWDYEGILPPPVRVAPVDPAMLDAFAGKYDAGSPTPLSVSKTADGLVFKAETEGGWTETFLPASDTEFFGKGDGDTRAVFVRGDAGRVSEVIVIFRGRATRARKVS